MEWVKLDASYYNDRAIVRAGEAAEVLFLRCLAYCGAEENKGIVPKDVLARLAPTRTGARVAALIREGLLTDLGDDVHVRRWAEWQESLDTESDRRRRDRERKQAARDAAKSTDTSTDTSTGVPGLVPGPLLRKEVEVEVEKPSTTRKRVAQPAPDIFPITDAMATWGRANAPLITNPQAETAKFLDHHRARGSAFKDWAAAWRTWMGNAQTYAAERAGRGARPALAEGQLGTWDV